MKKNNIFKKTFLIIVFAIIPLMLVIGAASWIMLSEERIKPQYNPNSAFYQYLNGQEVTYDGSSKLPSSTYITIDSNVTYKYRKVGEITYTTGAPTNAGEYYINFSSSLDETEGGYPSSDVYFKINKATLSNPTVSVLYNQFETDTEDEYENYFSTEMNTSNIQYTSVFKFNEVEVPGTTIYSDSNSLSVGTYEYQYTFTPDSDNFNIYKDKVYITTYATVRYLDDDGSTELKKEYLALKSEITKFDPITSNYSNLGAYAEEKEELLNWYINGTAVVFPYKVTNNIDMVAEWKYTEHKLILENLEGHETETESREISYTIKTLPGEIVNPNLDYKYFKWWKLGDNKGPTNIIIDESTYLIYSGKTYTAYFYDIIVIDIIEINYSTSNRTFANLKSEVLKSSNISIADEKVSISDFSGILDFTYIHNGYYYYGNLNSISDGYEKSLTTTSYIAGSTYITKMKLSNTLAPYVIQYVSGDATSYIDGNNSYEAAIKYKTALIGSTLYTIEDAIAAANKSASSSNKVTISFCGSTTNYVETCFTNIDFETDNLNFNLKDVYKSEITISSYVTIFVPYEDSLTTKKEVKDKESTLGYGVFSSLRIFQNTILNFSANSSLIIGAEIDYAQPTTTKVLARGVIVNYGTLNFLGTSSLISYGFLKGGINDVNEPIGLINIYNGATAKESMVTYDFPGGTTTTAILKTAFPTNAWSLHSISCRSIIYSGASYSAYTWILDVEASASVIATSGNCLFKASEINDETYIEKWAVPARTTDENKDALYTITGSNQIAGQRDVIRLKGKYTDNSFSIEIDGTGFSSSPSIALPLGFMDITLLDGSQLTLGNASYLFMPGSINTINEGASLTVNSGINISFADYTNHLAHTNATGPKTDYDYKTYCVDKNPAKLIVNGTLTCNGNIGGYISTNSENSKLKFNNATLQSSFESLFCAYGASEDSGYVTYKVTGFYAYGLIYDGSTSKITNFNKTTYYGDLNNDEYCWSGSHGNTTNSIYGSVSGATEAGGCIAADTLITLADGTQKMVKDLLSTDLLLAFNHITGKFEVTPIAYIICHDNEDVNHRIIQLNFDDGTNIKIIYEHVFFDVELNKYVAITEDNVDEFINHHFTKFNESNEIEHIKLVSYDIYYEVTRSYEVVTYSNLVAITNNLVSASAYIDPLLNVFEFNSNYQYDEEKMIDDINKYGLFTYEEFSHLITQDVFNMHNVAYLKVAVGKGIMTWEDIIWLINAYYLYTD